MVAFCSCQSATVASILVLAHLVGAFNSMNRRIRGSFDHSTAHHNRLTSSVFALKSVKVFDGVLDDVTCKNVDYQVKFGGLGHSVFLRESPCRTSVESVIDSILTSAGDDSPIVEYWWREEWMNLEMHRDLDEKLAVQQGPVRFPNHAHVLYLNVGEQVNGPTVVLHDSSDRSKKSFDKISVVPALTGRLLRFDGDMMHAVPRPPLAYFDEAEGGTNLELWNRRRPVDENDPELSVFRRSVLLFNTWSDVPPHEIPQTPPPGTLKESDSEINKGEKLRTCLPRDLWRESDIDSSESVAVGGSEDRSVRLKIGLLGDIRRRERTDKYLNLYATVTIKDSFLNTVKGQDRTPYSFSVTNSPP